MFSGIGLTVVATVFLFFVYFFDWIIYGRSQFTLVGAENKTECKIDNDGEKQKKKKTKNKDDKQEGEDKKEETDKLKKFGLYHGFNEIPLKPVIAPWLTLMKDYVLFLITPIVEAADIVLDGLYVIKMARALNRFWISASIIRLMLKFYIVAVVKDVILNMFLITTFFTESVILSPQNNLSLQ